MIAALRGASQMIFDLYDTPELFQRLARRCTDLLVELVEEQQKITGAFAGGYEVEQLALWAPDRIIRMQEDGSAFFSPALYVQHLQGEDERQASSFPYSVIHLHSSSLFLLDRILDVEPLKCIQINKDVGGAEVPKMLPFSQNGPGPGEEASDPGKARSRRSAPSETRTDAEGALSPDRRGRTGGDARVSRIFSALAVVRP